MSISIEKLIITRLFYIFLQNQQNKCISYNVSWMSINGTVDIYIYI